MSPLKKPNPELIPFGITDMDYRRWLTKVLARLILNHSDVERDVTGVVFIQYSYDFEKLRAAQVWEFILDQIVTCETPKDIPTIEELRTRVKNSGLL